jgi:hypothetical protein
MTAAIADTTAETLGTGEIEFSNPDRGPYVMGSMLVSHLVKTYGWEAFLDLYAEAWSQRDAAELEQNFQALYGVSFDALWTATALTVPFATCVAAWPCAADPLVPGTPEALSDSCGESSFRSLTATAPGVLELDAEPGALQPEADGIAALLLACPADPGQPISGPFEWFGARSLADLVDGKYLVAAASDVTVTSRRRQDSMFGTDCDQLASLALDSDTPDYLLFEPRTAPYFLRLDLPVGAELLVTTEGAGSLQICPSCAASDECVTVEQAGRFPVRSGAVFHLPAMAQPGQLARLSLWAQ